MRKFCQPRCHPNRIDVSAVFTKKRQTATICNYPQNDAPLIWGLLQPHPPRQCDKRKPPLAANRRDWPRKTRPLPRLIAPFLQPVPLRPFDKRQTAISRECMQPVRASPLPYPSRPHLNRNLITQLAKSFFNTPTCSCCSPQTRSATGCESVILALFLSVGMQAATTDK
jgi:hypothetical protein